MKSLNSLPGELWNSVNDLIDEAIRDRMFFATVTLTDCSISITQVDSTNVLWRVSGKYLYNGEEFEVKSVIVRPEGKVREAK